MPPLSHPLISLVRLRAATLPLGMSSQDSLPYGLAAIWVHRRTHLVVALQVCSIGLDESLSRHISHSLRPGHAVPVLQAGLPKLLWLVLHEHCRRR